MGASGALKITIGVPFSSIYSESKSLRCLTDLWPQRASLVGELIDVDLLLELAAVMDGLLWRDGLFSSEASKANACCYRKASLDVAYILSLADTME